MSTHLFTSESVTEGHPDKIADQISDAILDDLLRQDPGSRVACETMVSTGLVFVAGEVKTSGYADIPKIARRVIEEIGYMNGETNTNKIYVNIIGGLGYSIDSSTTIDFRYSLPIIEDGFTIEDATFKNNLAFRVLSIGVVHAF